MHTYTRTHVYVLYAYMHVYKSTHTDTDKGTYIQIYKERVRLPTLFSSRRFRISLKGVRRARLSKVKSRSVFFEGGGRGMGEEGCGEEKQEEPEGENKKKDDEDEEEEEEEENLGVFVMEGRNGLKATAIATPSECH